MIILDTNVVSEPMRAQGGPAVQAWLDRQAAETLYLTATSLSELLVGIELIPTGKRREVLTASLNRLLERLFGPRILAFDKQAAVAYASVVERTRSSGYSISVADAQIAAIAEVSGFTVATRDTSPFEAAGTPIINPWTD
ncbi:type II toxin-antitoxin system VapC family toxin [Granulicella arctica]|uniref:Ribonuclease VapC n=1 Tax=Granulicella arctica TaxID=940613 RepID=A0A7Y9TFZ2_9BACT|nr:type II toxin-antitoxin system VapC family toxin [Granulicella arctica]NYF78160.1 hypothetical protein [Granulicella arctica]